MKPIPGKKDSLLHYLSAIACTVVFALYCSGRVGWFLMLMLVLAPVVSVLYTRILAGAVRVSFEAEETTLSKGETLQMIVHVENKYPLPSPPVRIRFLQEVSLRCDQEEAVCSVPPLQTVDITVSYTAILCGVSEVGIEASQTEDYLRLVSIPGKQDGRQKNARIGVAPEIADIGGEGEYLRNISQWAQGEDESENTLDISTGTFGGFPGYDHREYAPGDPVKRINWKLSAGREELYVRLDEARTGAGITVIVNPILEAEQPAEELLQLRQTLVEAALGHAGLLLAREFSVSFCYYSFEEKSWAQVELADESGLFELAGNLAYFQLTGNREIGYYPASVTESGGGAILFCTAVFRENLRTCVERLKTEETTVGIYDAASEGGFVL